MVDSTHEPERSPGPSRGELDLLGRYLAEIGFHPLLEREDEVRLAKCMEAGRTAKERLAGRRALSPSLVASLEATVRAGIEAREEFISANLRLVVSIAKRYHRRGVDLSDLVQEGNVGLMGAVERFDWRRGYKFSTYATWWIRKAVLEALADASPVHLPRQRRHQARVLADASDSFERDVGRMPGSKELADAAGMGIDDVAAVRRAAARVVSLSSPVDDHGSELGDLLADPDASPDAEALECLLPAEIEAVLAGLSPSAVRVLRLRYGLGGDRPRSSAEVAAVVAVSPARVRQIEQRALAVLRQRLSARSWAS